MRMQLIIRFGYGLTVPWVQRVPGGIPSAGESDGQVDEREGEGD
jgi:hypothetical protein